MGMENVLQAQRNAAHVESCSSDAPIGIFFGFKILPPLIAGFQITSLKYCCTYHKIQYFCFSLCLFQLLLISTKFLADSKKVTIIDPFDFDIVVRMKRANVFPKKIKQNLEVLKFIWNTIFYKKLVITFVSSKIRYT